MGVSNTAGTLDFINNMKTIAYIVLIFIAAICAYIFIKSTVMIAVTSTPVKEMYHRQLVITLDSVLDAHLNAAALKELKDKDSADIAY